MCLNDYDCGSAGLFIFVIAILGSIDMLFEKNNWDKCSGEFHDADGDEGDVHILICVSICERKSEDELEQV